MTKANFSAILSAPAPVKKQPEPVAEKTDAASTEDKAKETPSAESEAKETSASTNDKETGPRQALPSRTVPTVRLLRCSTLLLSCSRTLLPSKQLPLVAS